MNTKSWAYRVYPSIKGFSHPKYRGMVHADSMDDAVNNIIKICKISVIKKYDAFGHVMAEFILGQEQVTIVVYASPEYH